MAAIDRRGGQRDPAAVGRELDRVRKQVEEDLPHAALIRLHAQTRGRRRDGQRVAMLLHLGRHASRGLIEQGRHLHRLRFDLHPSCRDALQVQQLVDQLEQMPAVTGDRVEEVPLLS